MAWATHDERHLAAIRAIKPNSLLTVPLVARDRAIAQLVAQALERARLREG